MHFPSCFWLDRYCTGAKISGKEEYLAALAMQQPGQKIKSAGAAQLHMGTAFLHWVLRGAPEG